jgi:surface polysaccharide O-acyltransferase-like enzyme
MIEQNKRIIVFDVMRVVAAFAVVWQHVGGQGWNESFPSLEWEIRNLYVSIAQWSVPLFIMISGALFLAPEKQLIIRRLYGKNILRIVYVFLFWSLIYMIYTEGFDIDFKVAVVSILKGPPHFWFLKIMIGLYIMIPILKSVVPNRQAFRYLVIFSIVATFVIPELILRVGLYNMQWMDILNEYYDGFGIAPLGFLSYFVLGYYLYSYPTRKCVKYTIYVLALVSLIGSILLTHFCSHYLGWSFGFFYDDMRPFVMIQACAIFIFIKDYGTSISPIARHGIVCLSNCSLGIFLVHPIFLRMLNDFFAFNTSTYNPLFFIPIFVFIVFTISFFMVRIISYIPYLNKTVM